MAVAPQGREPAPIRFNGAQITRSGYGDHLNCGLSMPSWIKSQTCIAMDNEDTADCGDPEYEMSQENIDALNREMAKIQGAIKFGQWILAGALSFLSLVILGIAGVMWSNLISVAELKTQLTLLPEITQNTSKITDHDIEELKVRVSNLEQRFQSQQPERH
jgi:polyhydroxyalkanoate synthesis regulator phasin